MKWTLSEFRALPYDERLDWLAYEYQRQKAINDMVERASDGDKTYAESITAYALLALLRYG
jgi:hypothetical protein